MANTQAAAAAPDPYTLTADGIKEPPVGWKNSFRYLGPGLILSASIVGSGELIATANRYYRDDPRAYVVLTIDLDVVDAPDPVFAGQPVELLHETYAVDLVAVE